MFTKLTFKTQLLATVAIAALSVVFITAGSSPVSARHGAGNGSNASIFIATECVGGTWVNHANALSNNNSLMPVDIYETLNASQVIKIQDNVSLSITDRYYFDTNPQAGVSEDRMYIIVHNNVPLGDVEPTPNEAIATSNQVTTPCL